MCNAPTGIATLGIVLAICLPACSVLPRIAVPLQVDAAAETALRAMSDRLSSAGSLHFRSRNTYDPALAKHLGVPPSADVEVSIARPASLHARVVGPSSTSEIYADGKTLTIHNLTANFYAVGPLRKPNLDKAVDAITSFYGFTPPLADFVVANPFATMTRNCRTGRYLGKDTLHGVPCDHLEFTGEHVDWELWIGESDHLPRRFIITANKVQGDSRFIADFTHWKLDPAIPATRFTFTPPAGAEEIPMLGASGTPVQVQTRPQ